MSDGIQTHAEGFQRSDLSTFWHDSPKSKRGHLCGPSRLPSPAHAEPYAVGPGFSSLGSALACARWRRASSPDGMWQR